MEDSDIVFADVAGLLDSGGILMDIINIFMMKKVIQHIKHVKFLVVVTIPQLEESRGNSCRNLIESIQFMCQNGLATMIQSIQPALTKVKPSDEIDFGEIKYTMEEIFQNHIE